VLVYKGHRCLAVPVRPVVPGEQAAGYPSFRVKIIVSVLRDCTVDVMMGELEGG
jgi:hypothetical protein